MRVRIDLKFHLLHEKMLVCEASNDPSRENLTDPQTMSLQVLFVLS